MRGRYDFHMPYLAAKSLDQAFDLLAREDAAIIAGGTDMMVQAGNPWAGKSLLDVNDLPGFRGISRTDGGWRIGAATRWRDIIAAPLPPCFDGLRAAALQVGSVQIQNMGTIAGNLCNASPAADGVPPLLTLDAMVEIASPAGRRVVALADFITGVRRTVLGRQDLVSAILIPDPGNEARGGFVKLGSRAYLVISIAMVAALVRVEAGVIADIRVAVGSCAPVARRLPMLEAAYRGQPLAGLGPVDPAWLAGLAPISDLRASAEYRLDAAAHLIGRLLRQMLVPGGPTDG